MKPYALRLVEKDLSSKIIPYASMDQSMRNLIKSKLEKENAHLYCNCLYPEQKLELHFSSDNKIVPSKQHYVHADLCPKSELAKRMAIYNTAFQYKDDERKNIIVNVSLDFSKKKRSEVCGITFQTYKKPVVNHKMTVTALIKKLNMVTFHNMAFSSNANCYISFENLCRWVNWKTMHIFLDDKRTLKSLSIENDKMKFFYGEYIGHKEFTKSNTHIQLQSIIYSSYKDKKTGEFIDTQNTLKLSFNKNGLELALEEFKNTYNGMTVESAMEKGYKIICSGFYTKDVKEYNKCLDVHFILVSKYGLFSESRYEAEMYDYICDFLNENNLKSKYIFYKPWEFGSSIYENNYLEDGVIYDKENDDVYYLEVFGMNTPTYLKTKAHKEKLADEKLIKWNAYINEDKPNLNIFLNQIK